MRRHPRGQALIETAVCLPVALIALFGIIYFSRYGVLAERAQTAVRYGAMISYGKAPAYSAADIYNAIAAGGATRPVTCPSNVQSDTLKVLSEQLYASPTPAPYWRPDSATAVCAQSTLSFSGTATSPTHMFTVTTLTANATVTVPSLLQKLLGTSTVGTAKFSYVRADPPSVIMYCTGSGPSIAAALGASYSGGGTC